MLNCNKIKSLYEYLHEVYTHNPDVEELLLLANDIARCRHIAHLKVVFLNPVKAYQLTVLINPSLFDTRLLQLVYFALNIEQK